MNQLQTHPAPPAGVHRAGEAARVVVIAVLAVSAVALAIRLVERPPVVDRVAIVNDSRLELDVDTAGAPSGDWTPAGSVSPSGTASYADVIDHGSTWWFRVSAGTDVGAWPVSREQLERDDWRVHIPAAVLDALGTKNSG